LRGRADRCDVSKTRCLDRPYLEGVRLHDLRHSFASFSAGASFGLPIIGKLLEHSQLATTQRYAHLDSDPLRRAVDAIGETISAAMEGRTRQESEPPAK